MQLRPKEDEEPAEEEADEEEVEANQSNKAAVIFSLVTLGATALSYAVINKA